MTDEEREAAVKRLMTEYRQITLRREIRYYRSFRGRCHIYIRYVRMGYPLRALKVFWIRGEEIQIKRVVI